MRRALAVLVLLALGGVAIAANSGSDTLFADGFGGSKLDRGKWRRCHWWATRGCTIATNHEREWYLPGQVRVSGGRAHLVAERRETTGSDGRRYPFASGMISTGPGPERKPRFAFTYGRAAIRAKLPNGDGLWPAFWLLPADRHSEPEIDVVEVQSDEPDTATMHLHYRADGEERSLGHRWDGLEPGWHTFTVDWRPGRLTWLVDGETRWRVRGDMVPDEPMYLIVNLAVSQDPPPTAETPDRSELAIDWVRVTR
jgi:beta-glucanase (GH16 family)